MSGPSFVYFIKPIGMDGPIKIGCSAVPPRRMRALQAWVPFELELLATIPGGFDLERRVQAVFAPAHLHAEWFRPIPELIEAINKLAAGIPVEEAMTLPARAAAIRFTSEELRLHISAKQKAIWAERRARRENEAVH